MQAQSKILEPLCYMKSLAVICHIPSCSCNVVTVHQRVSNGTFVGVSGKREWDKNGKWEWELPMEIPDKGYHVKVRLCFF